MNVAVKRCGELAQDVSYKTPPSPNIVDPESVDDHFTYGGYSVPAPSYHSCFGLPYQDHNYVAPPPPTPPPSPPPPPKEQIVPHVVDKELVNGHIEVEDVSVGPPAAFTDVVAKELSVDDDSITRCICDYKHDDGYMICCDKCSVWQHIDCMQVDRANIPELYFCEICDPRPVNREFARDLQTKRKELLIDTDSSATDTDPEEAMNRQMSEQQQQQQLQHGQQDKIKKTKKKRLVKIKGEPKNGATHGKIDKVSRKQKDKRELKKEKENKETDRKPKFSLKEAISKKINSKGKFKKSGLSLITNENSRNPYDSSNSPWVDKYEEAKVNQYTTEIETLLILRINGQHASLAPPLTEKLQAQLCNVTEVGKNRKGLEATETIGEGEPIIEYKGQVMLKQQFEKEHSFSKQFNPFVLFYNKFENVEMCINATSYGNNARFIRRSCKANAEVKHVIQNGEMAFYIFSSKVIPRGSELTIPYDYSYKECSYCVECACLRNNCPVAKFFKRKNLQKKEKIVKPPKSPSKTPGKICRSPTKSPVKSPIATLAESPLKSDTSSQPSATSSRKSSEEGSEIHKSVKERKNQSQETVKALETSTDSNSANIDSHSETEENAVEKIHKKTREERKMEAIMKAFEKLEKRQERRKEALARMDSRTHKENEEDNHTIEEKKCETTPTQVREEDTVAVESEVEKEKTEPLTPIKELVVPEETVKEVEEPAKTDVTQFKREVRPRTAKRSRRATISGRRKSRMNSNNSSERSASVEEVATVQSCPATPIVSSSSSGLSGPDTLNTPPSFKFLKTKKHLMSEWLSEKVSEQPSKSSVDKDQNEPVEITVTAFVTCLPSPRNSMEHLRRNSQSTGGSRLADRGTDNSAGSAKKRWLRQAMGDNPGPESSAAGAPLSSCASPGALSPNPALGMPSPCASPPGDFVTPLKKRRLARESLDNPLPVANNNPASTTAMTIGSDLAVQEDGEVCNTGSHVSPDTQSSDWSEIKGFKKKFAARRMREFSGESQRDSTESEAACSSLNNTVCRNSFDLSDLEQETISTSEATCAQNISTSRPGLCDSNTDEKMSQERLHSVGSSSVKKGFLNRSTLVCQSSVESETDQPMDTSECDSNTRGTAIGDMEVDSSVDSSRPSSVADPTICDSTSRGDESRPRVQDQLEIASTSQEEEETEGFEGSRESRTLVSVVDSSTDFEQVDSAMCNSGLAQADQSTESDSSVWRTRTNSFDSCEAASSKDGRASVESFEENSDLSSSVSRIRHLSSSASSLRSENVGSSSDKKRGNSLFDVSSSSETSKQDLVESSLTGDSGRNVSSTEQGGPYEPVVSGTHNSVVSASGVDQSPKNSVSASNVGSSPSLVSASFNSNSSPGNNSVSASNLSLPDDAADSSIGPTLCRLDLDESSASGSIGEAEGVSNSVGVCSHLEQEQRHMDYGLDIGIRHQDEIASSSSSNVSSMSPMLLDESSNYASSSVLTSLSQTNSMEEPPPPPPPAKKKVSLLEYRKRLKGKSSSNGSSATSSLSPSIPPPLPPPAPSPSSSLSSSFVSSPVASTSGTPTSASPAMTSAKSTSLLSSPKSLSLFETPGLPAAPPPPPPKRSSVSSRHLPTLPSLPLFETSPGKEPPRHHFRSSSDLIKKKAPEPKKREKPLSLTERLKMEFGIADNDEDNKKDQSLALRKRGQDAYDSARNASSSSSSRQGATTPPPPPPPPPSRSQTTDVLCRGSGVGGQGSKAGHEAESTLVPPPPPVPPAQQTPMYSGVPLPVPPPAHNPLGIRATSPAGMVLPIPGPPGKIGPMNGLTPTASSVQPNGPGLVPNAGLMPPRIPNLGQPRMVQNGQGRPPGKQIPSLLTIQPFAPLKNQNGMLMSSGPRVASPKPVPPVAGHGLIPPDKADAGLVYSHPAGVPDQAIALSDQPSGAPQANIPLKTNPGGAFDQVGFTQPGFSQQPNGGNYGANSEGNNMSVDYHHGFRSGSVEEYEADFSAKTEDYSSQDFHQDYSSNASDGYGGYNHDYSSSNDNDYKHNYGSSKGGGGRDHRLFSHSPSSNYHSSASRYHPKPGKGYSHSKHRRKGYSDSY